MNYDIFMQDWEASVTAYMREWEAYVTSAKQEWEAGVISALAEWEAAMSALPDGAPHLIHTPPMVTAETVFIKLKSQADSTPASLEPPDRDPLDMIER